MNYEEFSKAAKFQEILQLIPENERAEVEKAIRAMVSDFNDKVLQPLESIAQK